MDKIDAIKVPRGRPRPAPAADVDRVLAAICSRRPHKDVPLYPALVNLPLSMVHRIGARAGRTVITKLVNAFRRMHRQPLAMGRRARPAATFVPPRPGPGPGRGDWRGRRAGFRCVIR
jgi:hypothetical protein